MKLTFSVLVRLLTVLILSSVAFCAAQSAPAAAQTPDRSPSAQNSQAQTNPVQTNPVPTDPKKNDDPKKDDRLFYVIPNYLTVDGASQVKPISWKEKFAISAKGSFDPYEFTVVGIVAGIRQAENSSPAFGQGAEGYGKRYGATFADQVDGNVMVGGLFPAILKIDPRYFRLGRGSFASRFGYAVDRIFIARTDAGGHTFNVPEFAGNATAIAISNVYYPAADRGFSSSLSDWGTQMGLDAFGNELKEFWPDVHHYLQRRQQRRLQKKQEKASQ